MPASAVITVRIDPQLLAALKDKARREGRTVSAAIVRLVANEVRARRTRAGKPRPTIGMFQSFDAPALREFRTSRDALSSRLLRAAARTPRRR